MMVKNIIFDLGNVLLDFKPELFLSEKYSEDINLQERLYQEIFQSKEWVMLDKGTLGQEEVVDILSERHPNDADKIKEIFHSWTEMLKPISGTVSILEKLKLYNYKLYVLSNYHIKAFDKVFEENTFFQYFDGMVIFAKEKTIKLERKIYQKLIKRYQIIPKESIFIDDTIENLKGAEKFEFNTILFSSPLELSQELGEVGIVLTDK